MLPLIQLLRVAIGRTACLDTPLDEAAWLALLETAKKQTITGILMEGIKRLPPSQQPDTETMFTWLAAAERTKQNSRRLNKCAVLLTERLKRDDFTCVLLKGQGISLCYPEPLTRTAGDIDLWMSGGREKIVSYIRTFFPRVSVVYHHMDLPVFKKVSVEAHFTPSWMYNPFANRRLQRWFRKMWAGETQNVAALPENAGNISISTPAFNRVFIALHIFRHLLDEGIGLRQLLDYYYVLQTDEATNEERDESIQILTSLGLQHFMRGLMYALHELFGLEKEKMLFPPNEKEGRFLINEIMQAGNFGRYDTRFAQEQQGDTHLRRFLRKQQRNAHFITHYPSEVLWHPVFRIWQFVWRWYKNYL